MGVLSWTGRFARKLPSFFVECCVANHLHSFYYAVYEPAGPELMDTLFEETMAELESAGVRRILQSLK